MRRANDIDSAGPLGERRSTLGQTPPATGSGLDRAAGRALPKNTTQAFLTKADRAYPIHVADVFRYLGYDVEVNGIRLWAIGQLDDRYRREHDLLWTIPPSGIAHDIE
jgi:hypothetical protein